jgi:hypothetical protein
MTRREVDCHAGKKVQASPSLSTPASPSNKRPGSALTDDTNIHSQISATSSSTFPESYLANRYELTLRFHQDLEISMGSMARSSDLSTSRLMIRLSLGILEPQSPNQSALFSRN